MPTAMINTAATERIQLQAKRIRMARAAMNASLMELAERVSERLGQPISHEMLRRIEQGRRDCEYALLRAIAEVVGPYIEEETTTPLGWLGGGGEPVFVNPGYVSRGGEVVDIRRERAKRGWVDRPDREEFPPVSGISQLSA